MTTEHLSLSPHPDQETAARAAATALSAELSSLAQARTPVLLLVSGGSALRILDEIDPSGLGELLTLGVLDECYSSDPAVNNFHQLMQTRLYQAAQASGASLIDSRVQNNETQADLRARLEQALRQWTATHPTGVIVITQGIGPDGHTAGVLPFPEDPGKFATLFMDDAVWVAAYDASDKNPHPLRVTTTLAFLQQVHSSILFACSVDKKAALDATLAEVGALAQTPARIIHQMRRVQVFTDISD